MFVDPCEQGMLQCPVPTKIGSLVSLKNVYKSWGNEKINYVSDTRPFPPFKPPDSEEILELAEPAMISLINGLLADFGIPNTLPFIAQFKNNADGDKWEDFSFIDQIKIAAVMFQLNHSVPNSNKQHENLLLNNNRFLVSLSITDGKIEIKIMDTTKEPMANIVSRISVEDDSEFIALKNE